MKITNTTMNNGIYKKTQNNKHPKPKKLKTTNTKRQPKKKGKQTHRKII